MMLSLIVKKSAWLILGLGLAACATVSKPGGEADQTFESKATIQQGPPSAPPTPSLEAKTLPDLGPAPNFTNDVWLNTENPLNLEILRGKVVLVEFWTFG
jgi:hypothetical protein